jgi:hypothetical protein
VQSGGEKNGQISQVQRSFGPSIKWPAEAHSCMGLATLCTQDGGTAPLCCCSTLGCPRSQRSAGKPGPGHRAHLWLDSSSRRAPGVALARSVCCSTLSLGLHVKASTGSELLAGCSRMHSPSIRHWLWVSQLSEMMLPTSMRLSTSTLVGQHASSSPGSGVLVVVGLAVVAAAEMKFLNCARWRHGR